MVRSSSLARDGLTSTVTCGNTGLFVRLLMPCLVHYPRECEPNVSVRWGVPGGERPRVADTSFQW